MTLMGLFTLCIVVFIPVIYRLHARIQQLEGKVARVEQTYFMIKAKQRFKS